MSSGGSVEWTITATKTPNGPTDGKITGSASFELPAAQTGLTTAIASSIVTDSCNFTAACTPSAVGTKVCPYTCTFDAATATLPRTITATLENGATVVSTSSVSVTPTANPAADAALVEDADVTPPINETITVTTTFKRNATYDCQSPVCDGADAENMVTLTPEAGAALQVNASVPLICSCNTPAVPTVTATGSYNQPYDW